MTEQTAPRPRRMRRARARAYLKEVHDIDMEEKTLANRNARGLGPRPQYLGTIPYYTAETLDAWAETAFTDASPVAVTRRRARELLAEAEERAVRVGKARREEGSTKSRIFTAENPEPAAVQRRRAVHQGIL